MISFTIPNTPEALRAMATALNTMAGDQPRACNCVKDLALQDEVVERAFDRVIIGAVTAPAVTQERTTDHYAELKLKAAEEAGLVGPQETDAATAFGAMSTEDAPITGVIVQAEEIDVEGITWDERIHSSGKTKLKDGTWRLKGGVDLSVVTRIKALQLAGAETAQAVTETETAATSIPAEAARAFAAAAAVTETEDTVPANFGEFIKYVATKKREGALNDTILSNAIQAHGLTAFPQLAARPELIPGLHADLEVICTAS